MTTEVRAYRPYSYDILKPYEQACVDAYNAALTHAPPKLLKDWSAEDLHGFQSRYGIGLYFGVIIFPADWLPDGEGQQDSARRLDLTRILPEGVRPDSDEGKAILCPLLKAIFAIRLYNHAKVAEYSHQSQRGRFIQTSTWRSTIKTLRKLAAIGIAHRKNPFEPLFSHVTSRDFEALPDPIKNSVKTCLDYCFKHKIIDDWIVEAKPMLAEAPEALSKDEKPDFATPTGDIPDTIGFQSMSDEFVGEAGWRAAWFIEKLGPPLLACYEALQAPDIVRQTGSYQSMLRRQIIDGWDWTAPDGTPVNEFPFEFYLQQRTSDERLEIPLRKVTDVPGFSELHQVVFTLQACHAFGAALSFANRVSEHASFRIGALTEDVDGTISATGRTFKLAYNGGEGIERDWPVPQIILQALNQQEKLSCLLRLTDRKEGDPLWVQNSQKHPRLLNVNRAYKRFILAFGLQKLLGEDDNLSQHRFRKTIARLVAIAIVNGPELLMQLFGHRTMEMTIRYVLTNPDIVEEIRSIAADLAMLNSKRAIEIAESAGGMAAEKVVDFKFKEKARLGVDELGEENLTHAANVLSTMGHSALVVRPGVLCLKTPYEVGPCSKGRTAQDPRHCKTYCDHRFEDPKNRLTVDQTIEYIIGKIIQAENDDDLIGVQYLTGQLNTQMRRFKDLEAKWRHDPVVRRVLPDKYGDGCEGHDENYD